jgi:hypothetical protein
MLPYLIGVGLALAVGVFARLVGLDRDRAFYPTVLIVVASYYGLFAIMGGSLRELAVESVVIVTFVVMAVLGFKKTPWLVVAGLAAHGIFDFWHGHLIANAGVPAWWPAWCMSYDITAAVYLAVLLRSAKLQRS